MEGKHFALRPAAAVGDTKFIEKLKREINFLYTFGH